MTWRWGILGTGNIARSMAEALKLVSGAEMLAIGSRDQKTAQAFAGAWGLPRHYGSYDDLLADKDVDIVYVATPNSAHHHNIRAALRAGKHVLCEKPLCVSVELARECANEARALGLFLMEAMWSRFIPAVRQAVDRASMGEIGEITLLQADFCAVRKAADWPNLFDANLGGGALLDLGVYPLTLARDILGRHGNASGNVSMCDSGVDDEASIELSYASGAVAKLRCGFHENLPRRAAITGTTGRIVLPEPFHCAQKLVLESADGIPRMTIDLPPIGVGYAHQLIEVQSCLDKGMIESSIMPVTESIDVLETIDRLKQG